ncbi:PTS sugar transporter subunit IIA [Microbacterium halophytorum]|uniref:PTS sugar transporter subunit IIA n=1 Tax=Microbacterium halophytorum TaxID=2067568 RepID=UPI000CFA88D7|nr:PTS sugar transporter subunit IIA [Microbacterium halophytorum]
MTVQRQARVLGVLLDRGGWVTSAELADRIGVTPRSVRSYVTSINARTPGAVESGPSGYRAGDGAARARDGLRGVERSTPRERVRGLIRMLVERGEGVDVFDAATELHVSEATVEADLRRLRAELSGTELGLSRDDGLLALEGTERAKRRLLTRLVLDELGGGAFDAEALGRSAEAMGIPAGGAAGFRRDLVDALTGDGFVVNELAVSEVVLRVAIAVARTGGGHALPDVADDGRPERAIVGGALTVLAEQHFGAPLARADRRHLAGVVLSALVDGGESGAAPPPEIDGAARAALARAADEYGVDLGGEEFAASFAHHVQNVVRRSRERVGARNPMTRSVKLSSPLVFEIAVSIASELTDELGVPIPDDEIADIAMRIGSVTGQAPGDDALTAVLVCPGYEGLRLQLRAHLERALGHEIVITGVETGYEPDWASLDADLVLTTIDGPDGGDRRVRIQPFLTSRDIARVSEAAQRVRRQRRLSGLRAEMGRWFAPGAFIRNAPVSAPGDVIRMLGAALVREGVIDEAYIDSTIERERRSSTAFTESLAVPHAMTMSASRTAIAVAVNEQAIEWGTERVHVVAMAAFSAADRAAFQTVFEQFVDVFADPANSARVVRRAEDLPAFLDELAALIDQPV